jgi:hypothetical protein
MEGCMTAETRARPNPKESPMPDDAQWRAVIRHQRQCTTAAELARARAVGATPDPATMRGAEPTTLTFRAPGAAMAQRHAAWRIPADHPGAHRLDQLRAADLLDERHYANACAVLAIWIASGLGKSSGVGKYGRARTGRQGGEERGPEDDLRDLIESGEVDFQAVLMLVRGDLIGPYMFNRAKRGLARLDHITAKWDGEMVRGEKALTAPAPVRYCP